MSARCWIAALPLILGGCAQPEASGSASPVPADPAVASSEVDDAAWTRELLDHRAEIDEEFETSSTSPMAGVQRLSSEAVDRLFLLQQDGVFALSRSAALRAELAVARSDDGWAWEPVDEDVACEVEGEAVAPGSVLEGPALFSVADFHVRFYSGKDEVIFTVYDPQRPEKKAFEHLLYYPPDRRYAVTADLVRLPQPEEVEMLTSRSLKKSFYRYAKLRFRLGGEDLELTAYKMFLNGEGSESLFIPFRDATSGEETYGAGRFLDLDEPDGSRLVLDFNRAYNPLCNYSPAYNCPIPPRENHLPVAVRAGERTYPH